jgi:putative ABC transport system substrate-binding protein
VDDVEMRSLVADAVQWRPDAMATIGSGNVRRMRSATSTIPIIFGLVEDPVGDGLVASLGRPGANVTGAALAGDALAAKRLELACELVPGARRIAATYFSVESDQTRALTAMRVAASRLRRILIEVDLSRSAGGVDAGLRRVGTEGAEAIVPLGFEEAVDGESWKKIVACQDRLRAPLIHWSPDTATLGAVAGLGETLPDHFQRMADIMAAVLEGRTSAGSIPVSAAARVELHVNRTLASRLGIEVPGAILVRADRLL